MVSVKHENLSDKWCEHEISEAFGEAVCQQQNSSKFGNEKKEEEKNPDSQIQQLGICHTKSS